MSKFSPFNRGNLNDSEYYRMFLKDISLLPVKPFPDTIWNRHKESIQ